MYVNNYNLLNFAVSISESMIPHLRKYIYHPEIHLRKKTFEEEYEEFMKINNFLDDEQSGG